MSGSPSDHLEAALTDREHPSPLSIDDPFDDAPPTQTLPAPPPPSNESLDSWAVPAVSPPDAADAQPTLPPSPPEAAPGAPLLREAPSQPAYLSPPPSPPTSFPPGRYALPEAPRVDTRPTTPPTYDPERLRHEPPNPGSEITTVVVDPAPSGWRNTLLSAAAAAVVAALVTGGLFLALDDPDPTVIAADPDTSIVVPVRPADPGSNIQIGGPALDIQELLARAEGSVVSIETAANRGPIFGEGAGSGVAISDDGLVLTNAHVISLTDEITVRFFDGTRAAATIVGTLPNEDIAIIKAEDVSDVQPAELGSSTSLRVGDDVVAIGNALGLGGLPTVTEGIVSAKDREVEGPGFRLTGLIQTDAAINPGNSGGPLLNAAGQVVGINTAIIEGSQNVGFAISIDGVKPLIDEILEGGGLTNDTPALGATLNSVSDTQAEVLERFEVTVDEGVFLMNVEPDGAAERGGLRAGDVILAVDGSPVASSDALLAEIRSRAPEEVVAVSFERLGQSGEANVTLCRQTGC